MSIRITTTALVAATILKIDGRLTAADVAELAQSLRAASGPKVLDLTDLMWADREGTDVLRQLVSHGAQIRGASPFIEMLLQPQS